MNVRENRKGKQEWMDNLETLTILGTQDTWRWQTNHKNNTTQKTRRMSNTNHTKNHTNYTKNNTNHTTNRVWTQRHILSNAYLIICEGGNEGEGSRYMILYLIISLQLYDSLVLFCITGWFIRNTRPRSYLVYPLWHVVIIRSTNSFIHVAQIYLILKFSNETISNYI